MKKFIFIGIFLFVLILLGIFGSGLYNKIYYSSYVNSESFKSSSIEKKYELFNSKEFIENSSDETKEKVALILAETVISSGSAEDKVDLLDNSDFVHYASDDLRKKLIESIVDTPDISNETFNRFLFKVCRSTDFKIVANRIEDKKIVLPANVISEIDSNLSYISKNDEERSKWESIVSRNADALKQLTLEKANKVIEDSNFEKKVEFFKSVDYSKYLAQEMKEKLMDSILSLSLPDEKLISFLFKDCSFEDFEFAGDRVEKKGFVFKAETLYKIKTEISNNFHNSIVWKRIIEKFSAEKQEKLIELAKPVIENQNFVEKVNLYSSPDFLYFADDKIKIQLIDSMSSMNNIPRNKMNDFLFKTCNVEEFNFISKRIAETGCNWDFYLINNIKNDAGKSSKGYATNYWDSIIKNYKVLREKKAADAIKKVKESNSIKEKLEITKSGDFAYASFEVRKELALHIAETAIASGTVDEKISVFSTGNAKYSPQGLRQKLLHSIVDDPKIEDNQLRDVLLSCKGDECKFVVSKMVEKKVFLPKNYVARLIEIDLFRYIDKESVTKLFQDNLIGKRQLVVQAIEFLQYKKYYQLVNFTKYFDDILKVQPKSDLYKDIDSLRFLSGRPPFSPNQKITEDRIVEHKNTPVVKARVLDHFNKVLAEYDEEIKNSSNANQ